VKRELARGTEELEKEHRPLAMQDEGKKVHEGQRAWKQADRENMNVGGEKDMTKKKRL